jgi:hypothetical protein
LPNIVISFADRWRPVLGANLLTLHDLTAPIGRSRCVAGPFPTLTRRRFRVPGTPIRRAGLLEDWQIVSLGSGGPPWDHVRKCPTSLLRSCLSQLQSAARFSRNLNSVGLVCRSGWPAAVVLRNGRLSLGSLRPPVC